MNRRNFLQNNLIAGGAMLLGQNLFASKSNHPKLITEPSFKSNFAIHEGMFKNSAGLDFIDQIQFAYDQGFRSIEDNGMMKRTPEMQEKIGNKLAKLGMDMGVFVISLVPNSTVYLTNGQKDWREKFLQTCHEAVTVAKRVNAKYLTVVPGNYDRSLPMDIQTGNVIESLRPCADVLAKDNLVMVLEPLSDTPDLFLRYSDQTYAICKAVNSPACKILYDIYHMQRNEGNIIANIDRCWSEIAYIQIGDNPGRKEPGTGEINFRNIFKHLYNKGYRGILGMEHGNAQPGIQGEQALIKAYRDADQF